MKISTKLLTAFTAGLISVNSSANLQSATEKALEKNPEILANWHEFIGSGQDVNAAKASYKPSVDLIAGYGYRSRNYGPNRSFDGAYSEVSLTQAIYAGGEIRSQVRQAEALELVSYYRLLETAEAITLDVTAAYHDVVRQQELLKLAQDNLQKHNEVYKQIQESAEAGVARSVDLEQINGRLSLARANVITESANLHDVTARYLRLVGEMPPQSPSLDLFSPASIPATTTESLKEAYQYSPTYRAAVKDISANKAAFKIEKSKFRPRVDLIARHTNQEFDNLGFDESQEETRVDLQLSYNLYAGGGDVATKKRAFSNIDRATELRNKACIDIRQTVQIAQNDVGKFGDQLPILNQHKVSSDKVRTAYKQQFDIGQRTLLDVLDSENEFFQASRAWVNARYDQSIAIARTLSAMGKLLESLDIGFKDLPAKSDIDNTDYLKKSADWCPIQEVSAITDNFTDADFDGIQDHADNCFDTKPGQKVNASGCTILGASLLSINVDVQFDHNSSVVRERYNSVLEELAKSINHLNPEQVEIAGHTSIVGGEAYNQKLSERRANAIKNALIERFNIQPTILTAVGYGESMPIAAGDNEEAHTLNRRIEAHFKSSVQQADK